MTTVIIDDKMYQLCCEDKSVNRCLKCAFRHAGGHERLNKGYRSNWYGCGRIIRHIRDEFGRGFTCVDYTKGRFSFLQDVHPRGYYVPVDPLLEDLIRAEEMDNET